MRQCVACVRMRAKPWVRGRGGAGWERKSKQKTNDNLLRSLRVAFASGRSSIRDQRLKSYVEQNGRVLRVRFASTRETRQAAFTEPPEIFKLKNFPLYSCRSWCARARVKHSLAAFNNLISVHSAIMSRLACVLETILPSLSHSVIRKAASKLSPPLDENDTLVCVRCVNYLLWIRMNARERIARETTATNSPQIRIVDGWALL